MQSSRQQLYRKYIRLYSTALETAHVRSLARIKNGDSHHFVGSHNIVEQYISFIRQSPSLQHASSLVGDIVRAMEEPKRGVQVDEKLCNMLVQFFAQVGEKEHCINLMEEMRKGSMQATPSTYARVIDLLMDKGDSKRAHGVIESMLDANLQLTVSHFNTLLAYKISTDDLHGAWRVWRKMQADFVVPDKETINLLKQTEGTSWHLLLAEVSQRKPTLTTFILRIKNLGESGAVEEVKRTLQNMESLGIVPNTFIYNTVLGVMHKGGVDYAQCLGIVHEMKSRGVEPDVVTYNTLMNAKSKSGDVVGCFSLFEEMKAAQVEPDAISYNTLMDIKSKQGDEAGCYELLDAMLAKNISPDMYSFNILLRVAMIRSDVEACKKLLSQIKRQFDAPDIIAYNTMLECLAKNKDVDGCQLLLTEMDHFQVGPNEVSMNIILRHLPSAGNLHTQLKHITRGVETYNVLINSAISQGNTKTIIQLLREMSESRTTPDAITYSTVLKAITAAKKFSSNWANQSGISSDVAEMQSALEGMKRIGVKPNAYAYHILVAEAAEKGDVTGCQLLVEEMTRNGVPVDAFLYSNLMDKLAKRGLWKETLNIFADMKASRVTLDAGVYNVLLTHMAQNGSAQDCLSLFNEMQMNNIFPNLHTYSILMTACTKSRNVELCFRLLEDMQRRHISPVALSFMPLVPLILKHGDLVHFRNLMAIIKANNAADRLLYNKVLSGLQLLLERGGRKTFSVTVLVDEIQKLKSEMTAVGVDIDMVGPTTPGKFRPVDGAKPLKPHNINDMLRCL